MDSIWSPKKKQIPDHRARNPLTRAQCRAAPAPALILRFHSQAFTPTSQPYSQKPWLPPRACVIPCTMPGPLAGVVGKVRAIVKPVKGDVEMLAADEASWGWVWGCAAFRSFAVIGAVPALASPPTPLPGPAGHCQARAG